MISILPFPFKLAAWTLAKYDKYESMQEVWR